MRDEKWRKKKTKLTISGSPKKSFKNLDTSGSFKKKTVIIDKKSTKAPNRTGFSKPSSFSNFKKGQNPKPNFSSKNSLVTSNFEKRKLAEQRATKKLKTDNDNDKKTKLSGNKRQVKLTVSRALSDEIETRERSLASVKRARQKELKNANKENNEEKLKTVKRDINIPEAITVRELANRMAEQSSNVIKFLFGMGVSVTINQTLAADTAEIIKEFGHNPIREESREIIQKIKASRTET